MDQILTMDKLIDTVEEIFTKENSNKLIINFPNEECYNKYIKWLDEEITKVNNHRLKTKRSKVKMIKQIKVIENNKNKIIIKDKEDKDKRL